MTLVTAAARGNTPNPGSLASSPWASSAWAPTNEFATQEYQGTHDSVDAVGGDARPQSPQSPQSKDQEVIKLALKYVAYVDDSGKPVISQGDFKKITASINQLYATCKIQFVPEKYQPIQPRQFGFEFNTQSMNELDPIRAQFAEPNRLLVVNTGDWNHGTMGGANAWTAMPGGRPDGAIIEANAANFAGIVAHELGHYLSLDHLNDASNLMDPIIYETSTRFDAWQCEEMRRSAANHWAPMVR